MNRDILFWAPRGISLILAVLSGFYAIESAVLTDSRVEMISSILLNMLPALIIVIIVYLSWKNSLLGGILFLLMGLIFSVFYFNYSLKGDWGFFIISVPLAVVGLMFIASYFAEKFSKKPEENLSKKDSIFNR